MVSHPSYMEPVGYESFVPRMAALSIPFWRNRDRMFAAAICVLYVLYPIQTTTVVKYRHDPILPNLT